MTSQDIQAQTQHMTNWKRVSQRGGRNGRWPNRWVYCFGSLEHMEPKWLAAFCREGQSLGFEVVSGSDPGGTNLYILGPVGS